MTVVGIGVFDIETVWIIAARRNDMLNFTDAAGWWVSPVITCLVDVRIGHRVDIPIPVITKLCRVSLKISVVIEHLLRRIVILVIRADIAFGVVHTAMYMRVSECPCQGLAGWAIAARLGKGVRASRADSRNRANRRVFLVPDEAVRIMVLIFVSDCAHRAVVTDIVAALQERVSLLSCQIFMDVVGSIVVMRVSGVRDIRRAIRVIDSD